MEHSAASPARPVPGFPGYWATFDGRILSKKSGKPMRTKPDKDGYPALGLYRDGRQVFKCLHQFVGLAWLGPRPSPVHQVAHWDGNKVNTFVPNLRWATPKENKEDSDRLGETLLGEHNPAAKLTEAAVRLMRHLRAQGVAFDEIAARFGVSRQCANKAVRGDRWGHVA